MEHRHNPASVPITVTSIVIPYARNTVLAFCMIYRYASRLNFAGKKEYPFATSVFSSVMEDINSKIRGRTMHRVINIKTIFITA